MDQPQLAAGWISLGAPGTSGLALDGRVGGDTGIGGQAPREPRASNGE